LAAGSSPARLTKTYIILYIIMTSTILIHGYIGKELSWWLQWLESKLNYTQKVFFPSYINSKNPDMDEWMNLFHDKLVNKDCEYTFIAHSIGSLVTMKLIEKYDIHVKNMIVVGCPQNRISAHKQFTDKIDNIKREIFTQFVEQEYDWRLIASKIENISFFFSDNDYAIPYQETISYYKKKFPNALFKTFHNYGHFNYKSDISELPEILDIISLRDNA